MMARHASPGAERTEPRRDVGAGAVLLVAATFAFRKLDDFDTFWHLAAGRFIARHAAVPATDVLSHTVRDHAWINLQWGFDLGIYGLWAAGGAALLSVVSA